MPELIDRKATLEKMCELCGRCEWCEKAIRSRHPDFVTDKCKTYKLLAEQPILEAEPVRHGRWIKEASDMFDCSECGESIYWIFCEKKCSYSYCPNCGAYMREEDANNA